jgi:hypothetical protein
VQAQYSKISWIMSTLMRFVSSDINVKLARAISGLVTIFDRLWLCLSVHILCDSQRKKTNASLPWKDCLIFFVCNPLKILSSSQNTFCAEVVWSRSFKSTPRSIKSHTSLGPHEHLGSVELLKTLLFVKGLKSDYYIVFTFFFYIKLDLTLS